MSKKLSKFDYFQKLLTLIGINISVVASSIYFFLFFPFIGAIIAIIIIVTWTLLYYLVLKNSFFNGITIFNIFIKYDDYLSKT